MMWKIPTVQIREDIHDSFITRGLFPEKQNGCCKWTRGARELQYIDLPILKDSKTRRNNLVMSWINYKKAYKMVLQSWIIDCLKMNKIFGGHNVYQKYYAKRGWNWQQVEKA